MLRQFREVFLLLLTKIIVHISVGACTCPLLKESQQNTACRRSFCCPSAMANLCLFSPKNIEDNGLKDNIKIVNLNRIAGFSSHSRW